MLILTNFALQTRRDGGRRTIKKPYLPDFYKPRRFIMKSYTIIQGDCSHLYRSKDSFFYLITKPPIFTNKGLEKHIKKSVKITFCKCMYFPSYYQRKVVIISKKPPIFANEGLQEP